MSVLPRVKLSATETKIVETSDVEFARYIRSLNPYGINWSNMPDYLERKEFVKFARVFSVQETVHALQFMNWPQFILGASHVDGVAVRVECIDTGLHAKYKAGFDSFKWMYDELSVNYASNSFLLEVSKRKFSMKSTSFSAINLRMYSSITSCWTKNETSWTGSKNQ